MENCQQPCVPAFWATMPTAAAPHTFMVLSCSDRPQVPSSRMYYLLFLPTPLAPCPPPLHPPQQSWNSWVSSLAYTVADLVRGRKLTCSSLAKPGQPNFFHNVTGLLNPFTVPVNIPTTRETQVNLLVGKTEGIFNTVPTHAHELMNYQIELFKLTQAVCFCQVWWHSPVIMAIGETETGGLQDEDQHGKH